MAIIVVIVSLAVLQLLGMAAHRARWGTWVCRHREAYRPGEW